MEQKPYQHQEYPKVLYKQTGDGFEAVEVANAFQHEELGAGYVDSPAKFDVATAPAMQTPVEKAVAAKKADKSKK